MFVLHVQELPTLVMNVRLQELIQKPVLVQMECGKMPMKYVKIVATHVKLVQVLQTVVFYVKKIELEQIVFAQIILMMMVLIHFAHHVLTDVKNVQIVPLVVSVNQTEYLIMEFVNVQMDGMKNVEL